MLINGRYQILHPLQDGGFGHTFLAEDTQLPSRRRCVIKQLKPIQNNPEFYRLIQDRFQREAAIQETLGEACQDIPRLYAYFTEGNRFYLVEEWVDGETLSQKVAEVGPFSETTVRRILTDVLAILDAVHSRQIIHRDIKPDNIMLRKRDGKAVLIDFGAVKETMGAILDSKGKTAQSIVIGTAGYMAPEQSAGRPLFVSDLYSLGLTAIHLLTGKSPAELDIDPHSGKIDWRSHAPTLSETLARTIDKAIQIHPFERFANARAMGQALQAPTPQALVNEPTIVSRSPDLTAVVTQVVSPAGPDTDVAVVAQSPASSPNPWLRPFLIGAGIGGALLLGFLLVRGQTPVADVQPSPANTFSPTVSSSPSSASPSPSPEASSPSPEPSESPSPEPSSTAQASCGDANDSGTTWYPVFINNADLEQVRRDDCQDAIAKVREDGTPAVQVASFTDEQRANDFAQKVGGEVGKPYQLGASPSPSPSPSPSTSPSASPTDDPASETNAVIVDNGGSTNVRRGPGTTYGVQHIAYSGDRVRITDSAQDSGGYLWYKVYFPKSGATGWIAGQLLRPD
ncbi:MAG: serine/threonine protein kinase [Thermosynechococcaceae cyanobacterium]